MIRKLKAAIYIRVSTLFQAEEGVSLQVQRKELLAYCQLILGIEDCVVFEDPGYSAKNTDRPDYQRMMLRLRSGEFTHLVVWKLDRISRNLLDFCEMHSELTSLGVTFVSKTEQFDTSSAMGMAMMRIIMIFAELERQITSERVSANMLSQAASGHWNGGRVAYGYSYDKNEKAFALDVYEHSVYTQMCDRYIETNSLLDTSSYLNEKGYRTRSGNPWSAATVGKILRSVWYLGTYRYNVHSDGKGYQKRSENEWVEVTDHHVAAIDQEKFDRIQFLLSRNKRGGNEFGKTFKRTNIHMFAGLVQCGVCGANMSATLDRVRADGWRPSIYGCSNRRRSNDCSNKYISDATLGPFIFNLVANIIKAKDHATSRTTPERLEKILLKGPMFNDVSIFQSCLEDVRNALFAQTNQIDFTPNALIEKHTPDEVSELDLLQERKAKIESAINRLKTLYLYGDEAMPEKDFILERHRLLHELETINNEIDAHSKDEPANYLDNDELLEKASYFIMVDNLNSGRFVNYEKYIRTIAPEIPRKFITSIISKIVAANGKVTSVVFKNGLTINFIHKEKEPRP